MNNGAFFKSVSGSRIQSILPPSPVSRRLLNRFSQVLSRQGPPQTCRGSGSRNIFSTMSTQDSMDVDIATTSPTTIMRGRLQSPNCMHRMTLLRQNRQKQACLVADNSLLAVREFLTEVSTRRGQLTAQLDATHAEQVQIEEQIKECEVALASLEENLPLLLRRMSLSWCDTFWITKRSHYLWFRADVSLW